MRSLMQQLRLHAAANLRLGNLRFFTATPRFWEVMEQWREQCFIECGAGTGDTTREALDKGFQFGAVDICERDGQHESVLILDATMLTFSRELWPILCRPNHSGWCREVMDLALPASAGFIYVGLERNTEIDLGEYAGKHDAVFESVGEDGECLWYFAPRSAPPPTRAHYNK